MVVTEVPLVTAVDPSLWHAYGTAVSPRQVLDIPTRVLAAVALVLPRPLVLAALLVVMAGGKGGEAIAGSDAVGALAADVTTWTITGRGDVCIRLTGQLVRPRSRYLRRSGDALLLTRENALAGSPVFSPVPDVPRPKDGPKTAQRSGGH